MPSRRRRRGRAATCSNTTCPRPQRQFFPSRTQIQDLAHGRRQPETLYCSQTCFYEARRRKNPCPQTLICPDCGTHYPRDSYCLYRWRNGHTIIPCPACRRGWHRRDLQHGLPLRHPRDAVRVIEIMPMTRTPREIARWIVHEMLEEELSHGP